MRSRNYTAKVTVEETWEDEANLRDLELEIVCVLEPYIPQTWESPAEGGGCEIESIKVTKWTQWDADGNNPVAVDLEKLTYEQQVKLDKEACGHAEERRVRAGIEERASELANERDAESRIRD